MHASRFMISKEFYHKLLYFYFQDYIFELPEYEKRKYIREGFFAKLKMMAIGLLLNFKEVFKKPELDPSPLYNSNWVFVFGKNNYDATNFLEEDNFVFVTDRKRIFSNSEGIIQLPHRVKFRHYIKFISIFFLLLKIEGKRTYQLIDLIFNSIGWMEAFDNAVKKFKPKSITFSNDHSYIPRALLLMAKKNKVPTIYIQHATVTGSFPPLEFDLNLLEGQDAFDKYKAKGINGTVKFIGMPRFDKFYTKRKESVRGDIKTVGFAFNTVDSIDIIYEAIKDLIKELPSIKVVVRKHSKDPRDFKTPLKNINGNIIFSDSLSEDSFGFLLGCDLLIAGDSAIHLDACMLNVVSYYYNFSSGSKIKDLYGFLEKGFIKELTSIEDMSNHIKEGLSGRDVFMHAKYYNLLIGA